MNAGKELPTAGYRLLDVSAAYQHYSIIDAEDRDEPLQETRSTRFFWNWSVTAPRRFEVVLGILVTGTEDAPEEVDVRVVGTFAVEGEDPTLGIDTFVHTSAPAIILPYIREKITRLTADGPFGTYWLPIVNVQRLMKETHPYEESEGARQLAQNPRALESPVEDSEEP